eukprot:1939611-Prymnesium_polylepis.1
MRTAALDLAYLAEQRVVEGCPGVPTVFWSEHAAMATSSRAHVAALGAVYRSGRDALCCLNWYGFLWVGKTGCDWEWLGMAGIGWDWLESAGVSWNRLGSVGIGWLGLVGVGWGWLGLVG